jgi:hypothetical protein
MTVSRHWFTCISQKLYRLSGLLRWCPQILGREFRLVPDLSEVFFFLAIHSSFLIAFDYGKSLILAARPWKWRQHCLFRDVDGPTPTADPPARYGRTVPTQNAMFGPRGRILSEVLTHITICRPKQVLTAITPRNWENCRHVSYMSDLRFSQR